MLPKGASIRDSPCRDTLSKLRKKLQKGTSTRGLHDRNPARAGVAHFAGAPSKLCIYDNLTLPPVASHKYDLASHAQWLYHEILASRAFALQPVGSFGQICAFSLYLLESKAPQLLLSSYLIAGHTLSIEPFGEEVRSPGQKRGQH